MATVREFEVFHNSIDGFGTWEGEGTLGDAADRNRRSGIELVAQQEHQERPHEGCNRCPGKGTAPFVLSGLDEPVAQGKHCQCSMVETGQGDENKRGGATNSGLCIYALAVADEGPSQHSKCKDSKPTLHAVGERIECPVEG